MRGEVNHRHEQVETWIYVIWADMVPLEYPRGFAKIPLLEVLKDARYARYPRFILCGEYYLRT